MDSIVVSPINKVKQYLSLVKFSHTLFALPFAIISLIIKEAKMEINLITATQHL